MFKQQVIGVINLSVPIVILFQVYPNFVFSFIGKLVCSFLIGIYLFYLNRKTAKNMQNSLKFAPTSTNLEEFHKLIIACNVDPKDVKLNYAYTNEIIAMNVFNTIIMDPVVCSSFDEDPEALKVKDIFKTHIEPTLSAPQRDRLGEMRALLSPHVERFIFKHELGHLFYNFSNKKLMVVLAIGIASAYTGLAAASRAMHLGGILALFIGMLVGGIIDLLLSYASNILFKSREEKKADIFAARFSSLEEIEAAADFFEKHQYVVANNKDLGNKLAGIPSIITTGHHSGKSRACYLRKIAAEKADFFKC